MKKKKATKKGAAQSKAKARKQPVKKATKKAAQKKAAAPARKKKAKKSAAKAKSRFIKPDESSPAHSPGHRKINIYENFTEKHGAKVHLQDSAVNQMSRSDQIRRTSRTNRRVITGAAVGKTGRIVTEKS